MMRRSTWQPIAAAVSLFLRTERALDDTRDAQQWADAHEPVMEAAS